MKYSRQIAEFQKHNATPENVSWLSAEVIRIQQAIIGDLQAHSATKDQIKITTSDLMEVIAFVSSEINTMLAIGKFSIANDDIASLRDEITVVYYRCAD